jgi:hypothetical protein
VLALAMFCPLLERRQRKECEPDSEQQGDTKRSATLNVVDTIGYAIKTLANNLTSTQLTCESADDTEKFERRAERNKTNAVVLIMVLLAVCPKVMLPVPS